MLSIKSFTLYAQQNLGYDSHDLVTLNDKFKKPKIQSEYLEWQKSLKSTQSFKKVSHYNLPPI
ncbi:hypothetical protein ADP71_17700 [Vitreoscilla sp. C1]|nr:hypothetical protein ADP71_17700 [Vitreoscilla sp. C1]